MKSPVLYVVAIVIFLASFSVAIDSLRAQDAPQGQLEAALSYRPIQKDVEIDIPTDAEKARCRISLYDGRRGFLIKNPQDVTIRLFLDANGDGRVDQWSYFKNGVEVYRDVDSDGNGSADQFRWLNNAGTRWGIDSDGDQAIDSWKMISAEEVSREVVLALASGDLKRFLRVALSESELAELSLGETLHETVKKKIATFSSGFAEAAKSLELAKEVQWYQLGAVLPGLVPAGDHGNKNDLYVYENAMATVGRGAETKEITIGTLIRLDDGSWRTLDLPKPYSENQYSFTFIPPGTGMTGSGAAEADGEVIALINECSAIEAEIHNLPMDQRPAKHKQMILCMLKIIKLSPTKEDRDLWIRQLADTIMYAAQRNEFPEGGEQLRVLFETVRKDDNPELVAHVRFRQIMTDYFMEILSGTGSDPIEKQLNWIKSLESFIEEYEKTEAGVEAMAQLASYREMSPETTDESIKWYTKIAQTAPDKPIAEKAKGAIRRLTSAGKEIPFKSTDASGKAFDIASLKGSFVLLYFWDSRGASEIPAVNSVAERFTGAGLKVVGVNLDYDAQSMKSVASKITWPQLRSAGGLESAPAVYWGIQSTPYMILYGKDGKVLNPNVLSAGDLQQAMTEATK